MGDSIPLLSPQEREAFEMRALLFLAGELPPDDLAGFNLQLAAHRALREIFVDFCLLGGLLMEHQLGHRLRKPMQPPPMSAPEMTLMGQEFNFVDETDSDPLEAPDSPLAPSGGAEQLTSTSGRQAPLRRHGRWFGTVIRQFPWRIAGAILLCLMLGMIIWVASGHSSSSAIVANSIDAQWDSAATPISDGQLPAKTLTLRSGLVEVRLASSATVIVQGPARFRVGKDNSIDLDAGRLTARVPVAAHGFTVRTPSAVVVDLGTAFGVSVDFSGASSVHVFEGHVNVVEHRAGDDASAGQAPQALSAGDAAVVANGTLTLTPGGATPQAFVSSLSAPSAIDVVDLIAGGDGTTHRRAGGIDPRTGDAGLLNPVKTVGDTDTDYHAVPKLQVIDGCFVPDGNMKIDSAGHTFDFGKTTGSSFYDVRAGGTLAWPVPGDQFTAMLGGIDYSTAEHGLVLVHPNCGITFDLAALRRLHPGLAISKFTATAGNVHTDVTPPSNLFVLVDGVSRFERHSIRHDSGPIKIDVTLGDADRYLTIVTTDDGAFVGRDWIIFGDPRLE